MPLSDTTIRIAKPRGKLYRLTDANDLCLFAGILRIYKFSGLSPITSEHYALLLDLGSFQMGILAFEERYRALAPVGDPIT